jgi:hypothetical protein
MRRDEIERAKNSGTERTFSYRSGLDVEGACCRTMGKGQDGEPGLLVLKGSIMSWAGSSAWPVTARGDRTLTAAFDGHASDRRRHH